MTAKSNQTARGTRPLSEKHHMQIPWYDVIVSEERQADHATLEERASLVGRVGIMLLACGTGAWRVREAMNTVARKRCARFIIGSIRSRKCRVIMIRCEQDWLRRWRVALSFFCLAVVQLRWFAVLLARVSAIGCVVL